MSEPWWSDNYDGPCQWADRDPSNKPWCELHQSWGSIDAHACWFAALTDRAEKAEAQVQRVREVCEEPPGPPLGTPTAYGQGLQDGYGEALRTIRAALDGDGDE